MNVFDCHPDHLLRLHEIVGDGGVYPVSRSTWLNGVKSGRFPRPVVLAPKCKAWRAGDLQVLLRRTKAASLEAS